MTGRTPRAEGPDFVGVGVQKCGTTWLADILSQHPGVLVNKKEIGFYVHRFHRGYEWYHKWFEDKGERLAGEISVNYFVTPRPDSTHKEFYPKWNPRRGMLFWRKRPAARDELKENYPGLKVFAIFRNPVDRAWSHYWFWRNRKERLGKRIIPFERMFEDDGRWIRLQGCYADKLAYWREAFPDMAAFLFDDLRNRPGELAREVYRFIGIDDSFEPVLQKKVNKGKYDPMPPETREMLIEAYRDQIQRFAGMIGRDLSHWLEPRS